MVFHCFSAPPTDPQTQEHNEKKKKSIFPEVTLFSLNRSLGENPVCKSLLEMLIKIWMPYKSFWQDLFCEVNTFQNKKEIAEPTASYTKRNNQFFLQICLGPPGQAVSQEHPPQPDAEQDSDRQILEEPTYTPGVEQLWLMSFLKVDQTLMRRRGNWSKGVLNYLMRVSGWGKLSLSERCLIRSFFYPAGSHGRSLHNKRVTWPDPSST